MVILLKRSLLIVIQTDHCKCITVNMFHSCLYWLMHLFKLVLNPEHSFNTSEVWREGKSDSVPFSGVDCMRKTLTLKYSTLSALNTGNVFGDQVHMQ